jgi:hypothetical protein
MAKPAPRKHRKGGEHVAKGQNMKKEKKKPKKEKK